MDIPIVRWLARAMTIFAIASPALCQQFFPYLATTGQVSLSSQAYAATLQQPPATCGASGTAICSSVVAFPASGAPGGGRPYGGGQNKAGLSIYCSVACTASFIVGATAATATAGTVSPAYGSGAPPPLVQFFTASNYSGGVTQKVFNIGASSEYLLDMSDVKLLAGGSDVNITIAIASMTGTVNITFYPLEQH